MLITLVREFGSGSRYEIWQEGSADMIGIARIYGTTRKSVRRWAESYIDCKGIIQVSNTKLGYDVRVQ